jgi:hypothetical protein
MRDNGFARDSSIRHWLKVQRWKLRRRRAALLWGADELARTPSVLGTAMPKSGSHLINQILQGLTRIGPFVNSGFPPVNRTENNRSLTEEGILANILEMLPGDFRYGYVHARDPYIEAVARPGRAIIFVYRDPRDMIVSHVFYATEMNSSHGMHQYYTQTLRTMEKRINAAIEGVFVEGLKLSGVAARYDAYLGWLEQPEVLCLRFEDLIEKRDDTLMKVLAYLESRGMALRLDRMEAMQRIKTAIIPSKSGTFRKGKPGNWQDFFTESNRRTLKQHGGDLLIRLGYERDLDW